MNYDGTINLRKKGQVTNLSFSFVLVNI